jgi:large conductance mechanosensitive channel
MLKDFGKFLLRGNVVDLAVAVVIGGAFGAIVTALVKDLITPLIAAIVGKPDFSAIAFTMNNSKFAVGDFVNAVVAFILVAFAIYFFVVAPMNAMTVRYKKPEETPKLRECPECLSETSPQGPGAANSAPPSWRSTRGLDPWGRAAVAFGVGPSRVSRPARRARCPR